MKKCLVAAFLLLSFPAFAAPGPEVKLYPTEREAAAACGRDTVAWLNSNTGVFHLQGMKYFGKTKEGGFGCRTDLERAGKTLSKSKT